MYAPTAKGTEPRTTSGRPPDHGEEAERRHELARQLRDPVPPMLRGEEERRLLEHDVGDRHADEGPDELRRDVARHLAPGQAPLARIRQRHDRIEVRARDRSEGDDQRDQRRARREGVGEQRERDVRARELLGHDPRPDDRGQQQRRSERLGDELSQQHLPPPFLQQSSHK